MSVREDIAKKLAVNKGWEYGLLSQPYRNGLLEEADDLFSLKYDNGQPKLGVIAEDQSFVLPNWYDELTMDRMSYQAGVVDTWNEVSRANFKRIEK